MAAVMIVDDQPDVARTFARILVRAGHSVETYQEGNSAVRRLAERQFDAVVSDIGMPGLDGIALLREIRKRDLDVPVILVTGAPSMSSAIAAVEHGALRYLSKPVTSDVLRQTVALAVRLGRIGRVRRQLLEANGFKEGHLADRACLESRFDRALEQLFMVYQPIIHWPSRSVYGYEALVRSEELTLSTPSALFDAADRLGRLRDLSAQIRMLCAEPWFRAPADAVLCVNVHSRELLDEDLFREEGRLFESAAHVVLEVTEKSRLEQVPELPQRVARLRAMGFRVALDDVGAGYAGLTSFSLLNPDVVKLDAALVRDLNASPVKQRLVCTMTGLCRELGMSVIAECVETNAERDALTGLGVDLLQGFLFSRPAAPFVQPDLEGYPRPRPAHA